MEVVYKTAVSHTKARPSLLKTKIAGQMEDVYKRQLHIMAKLGDPSRRRKNIPELSRAVNTEKGTNQSIYFTASGVRRSEPPKKCTTCGANEPNNVEVHISNSEDTAIDWVILMRAAFTFPCDK